MIHRFRNHWSQEIDDVIRSKHYTWLAMGLGGDPVEDAMTTLLVDIMHICKRQAIDWEQMVEKSRTRFEMEEADLPNKA